MIERNERFPAAFVFRRSRVLTGGMIIWSRLCLNVVIFVFYLYVLKLISS